MTEYQDQDHNYYHTGMIAFKGRHIRFCTFQNRMAIKSRFLPLRLDQEQAEADLQAYAKRKQWEKIVYVKQED